MSAEKTRNVTVQFEDELLEKIDERAEALDLNRSQYLRRLARKDLGIPMPNFGQEQAVAA